jgi:hypothetical protein
MSKLLISSKKNEQEFDELLKKELPTYRQAYSDRTAWIMSCVAELAYIKFNPLLPEEELNDLVTDHLNQITEDDAHLSKLLKNFRYSHKDEKKALIKNLGFLSLELLETFDSNGTQAILVGNSQYSILAFRGTEPTSFKDIRSDAKANSKRCSSGGNIHSGFSEAYDEVSYQIEERLATSDVKDKPLYITGHSLGGALATVAAKKLSHKGGVAGCYTFGSPRVGDAIWSSGIKAPIYRVVNAADAVTMLPPGGLVIKALGWIARLTPRVGKALQRFLLARFNGYMHCGDMRYLSNCKSGAYDDAQLLYSVNIFYRLKGFSFQWASFKKMLSDHSITVYRKKLMCIAQKRNNLRREV